MAPALKASIWTHSFSPGKKIMQRSPKRSVPPTPPRTGHPLPPGGRGGGGWFNLQPLWGGRRPGKNLWPYFWLEKLTSVRVRDRLLVGVKMKSESTQFQELNKANFNQCRTNKNRPNLYQSPLVKRGEMSHWSLIPPLVGRPKKRFAKWHLGGGVTKQLAWEEGLAGAEGAPKHSNALNWQSKNGADPKKT